MLLYIEEHGGAIKTVADFFFPILLFASWKLVNTTEIRQIPHVFSVPATPSFLLY